MGRMDFPKISLKAARINAEMEESEAARQIGICRNTLRNYEKRRTKPKIAIRERMAKVYGIPLEYLGD
ncbi:MAG: helix-turn-helix transcriptional regulator [Clostridia bacterium]|nr:helix-turn-helix transcriptional regulator [Clostridia bacterium]